MNNREFSLAYLTYAPLPPPSALDLAARLGYQAIGLRVFPAVTGGAYQNLIDDKTLRRDTLAAIRSSGVSIFDVEIIRIGADFKPQSCLAFLELCADMQAKAVLVAGDDPDISRMTASYAAFCGLANEYNLTADLEFMPWTEVPDARSALSIVQAAQQPNGRVLVDTLHVGRSNTTLNDLAAIPSELLSYAQICDAVAGRNFSVEEMTYTARCARLLPGEGNIDITGIMKQLPEELPLSIEIPNEERIHQLGIDAWAKEALQAARRLFVPKIND